jgi:SAM-dependent methyltransferase
MSRTLRLARRLGALPDAGEAGAMERRSMARKGKPLLPGPRFPTLDDYVATIDAFNDNRPDMDPIRAFNHQMIDTLAEIRSLTGLRVLDVGASPHGYGLEKALQAGASVYVGIGLAVGAAAEVREGQQLGWLMSGDAEELGFADETFDAILSLSTFEHFADGAKVLREMHRVLKPEGIALFHFQPVWTSSYGHHLHHFPSVGRLIPPWAHLLWGEGRMREALRGQWPSDAPISLEQAVHWVYRGNEINRLEVSAVRALFRECALRTEWLTPLMDDDSNNKRLVAEFLSAILPYTHEDLMTLGFAALMRKTSARSGGAAD